MKNYILSAAAILMLVACNKEANPVSVSSGENAPGNMEIAVNTATSRTKGYLAGATFFDTAIEELHSGTSGEPSTETVAREMKLSAFLTPQSGQADNYFSDFTFSKGSDGNWHHTPAIYWPVGGQLDFLAYSSMVPFEAKDVIWNGKNATDGLVLKVQGTHTQDDIVYASAYSQSSSDGTGPVAMEFKHTQAWLEFQIKVADEGMLDKIAIKGIVIENAYDSGELTITRSGSTAKAEWSFLQEQNKDIEFEDNYNLYGTSEDGVLTNALTNEISYMDMLLPAQRKTGFIIRYTLAGLDKELQYRYDLSSTGTAEWLMGKKYVYAITFNVNEITVAPTVLEYSGGDASGLIPSSLV